MRHSRSEGMSRLAFRLMNAFFVLRDRLFPHIDRRIATFGIQEGLTLVDYGCGPGRYTTRLARLVGPTGKVYAVDIEPLALEYVRAAIRKQGLNNVEPTLAHGYDSGVPDHVADMVLAIDMFHHVQQPVAFMAELRRITKEEGLLLIDDGHQPRPTTKAKLLEGGGWTVYRETPDHLLCRPVHAISQDA